MRTLDRLARNNLRPNRSSVIMQGPAHMQTVKICLPLLVLLAVALFSPPRASAQAIEVGGGYTYVHSNVPPGGCGCFSLNGGGAWAAVDLNDHFAIVAEVSVQHSSNVASSGGDLTLASYVFGPRYMLHSVKRLHPFAQVLVGGAHASGSEAPGSNGLPGSANAFAATMGGGLNYSLTEHWSLRPIEADYYLTHFTNGSNDHQNNLRISAGVFFHFGKK